MNVDRNSGFRADHRSGGAYALSNVASTLAGIGLGQQQQQQRLMLGGGAAAAGFDLSDRIAAFATLNVRNSGSALSMGKIGGGQHPSDILKNDGKFVKPVANLKDQPKKPVATEDTAAIAAVFPTTEKTAASAAAAASTTTTDEQVDDWKKQQRLEQNKLSARRSRKRKKIIQEELQATIDQLKAEHEELERENKVLEARLEQKRAKSAAAAGGGGRGGAPLKVNRNKKETNEVEVVASPPLRTPALAPAPVQAQVAYNNNIWTVPPAATNQSLLLSQQLGTIMGIMGQLAPPPAAQPIISLSLPPVSQPNIAPTTTSNNSIALLQHKLMARYQQLLQERTQQQQQQQQQQSNKRRRIN